MYVFAIGILLSLGLLAFALTGERLIPRAAAELWMFLLIGLGVGAAWLADFNLWAAWGLPVREDWIGVTLTGLALAGMAEFVHQTMRLIGGAIRKLNDQAATLEKTEGLRKVA